MLADVVSAADPVEATVIGDWAPRGGISTRVTAKYRRAGDSPQSAGAERNGSYRI